MRHPLFTVATLLMVTLMACSNMPSVTRTGTVKNVVIRDDLKPQVVTVSSGDEVRWVNQRQGAVRVEFIDTIKNAISCNDGFYRLELIGAGVDNTATLSPDETASLCFHEVGKKRYVVRMDSTTPGGEANLSGTLDVQ